MSMDIDIILLPEFPCAYLVDDKLFDGETIRVRDDSVAYLTVLPLDAEFIPYTVKLIGPKAASNSALALSVRTGEREYALALGKRYHVYSSEHRNLPDDPCRKFFYYVKGRHFSLAFDLLGDISPRPGEAELSKFFEDYTDIIRLKDRYYVVDGSGVGHRCEFTVSGGKIDNISVE